MDLKQSWIYSYLDIKQASIHLQGDVYATAG